MRLIVGARHHHHRSGLRDIGPARGQVPGTRRGGHTKDARFRQMGPEGVDERCYAAITTA
jgi:hypothetical protein